MIVHASVRAGCILADLARAITAGLDTEMAWAEDPPSRTRHLIGNLEAALLENGEAKTAFLVYRSHLETDHQLLSGCREDVLRKMNGAWKVRRRTRNGPTAIENAGPDN